MTLFISPQFLTKAITVEAFDQHLGSLVEPCHESELVDPHSCRSSSATTATTATSGVGALPKSMTIGKSGIDNSSKTTFAIDNGRHQTLA